MCKKTTLTSRKRVVRDTTGLLSSDWSKITFVFSYPKCDEIVTESEIGNFGEDENCCIVVTFWKEVVISFIINYNVFKLWST